MCGWMLWVDGCGKKLGYLDYLHDLSAAFDSPSVARLRSKTWVLVLQCRNFERNVGVLSTYLAWPVTFRMCCSRSGFMVMVCSAASV